MVRLANRTHRGFRGEQIYYNFSRVRTCVSESMVGRHLACHFLMDRHDAAPLNSQEQSLQARPHLKNE